MHTPARVSDDRLMAPKLGSPLTETRQTHYWATMWWMDVFVETDRVVLRRFTRDDLELIVGLDSDPGVKRYIDDSAAVDREELAENLDWWLGYYEKFEGYGFWAAIEKATGLFIGWFHFRPGESAGPLEPELGYRLHRRSWGQGTRPRCRGC